MQLLEKFAALGLGNLRFNRPSNQRAESVERGENRSLGASIRCRRRWRGYFTFDERMLHGAIRQGRGLVLVIELNRSQTAPVQIRQKIRPGDEKRVSLGNLLLIGIRVNGQGLRVAENENGFAR